MRRQSKKERDKGKFIYSFALLFLFVLSIGVVFVYSNVKFTGMAVISDYNDKASCESAGYTWENLTNCPECTLCADGCVSEYTETLCEAGCSETCGENETECTLCADGCVSEYTETLCEAGCSETCSTCTEDWKCTGDVCDSSHLNLCSTESTCNATSGYWYNSSCHASAQCIPTTCGPTNCGSKSDGCGSTLNCGTCSSGYTCSSSNVCESNTPTTPTKKSGGDKKSDKQIPTTTLVTANTAKTLESSCIPDWQCGDWQECVESSKIRVCTDLNECNSDEGMPETTQSCVVEIAETCTDNIKNQDETGIDCGGVCKRCNFFVMVGSSISDTIDAGKKFIFEGMFGSLVSTIISVVAIVVFIGGFSVLWFFASRKKGISKLDKIIDNLESKKN